jgi:hypothetical protein
MTSLPHAWPKPPPLYVEEQFAKVVNVAGGQDCEVYVGRPGRGRRDTGWGNPVRMGGNSIKSRIGAVVGFADHLRASTELSGRTGELSGRTLGCWCAPRPCHGHVLAGVANIAPWERAELFDWVEQLRTAQVAMPYRLLVTGSRQWQDRRTIADALNQQHRDWGRPADAVLVVGDAIGADAIAAELWAKAGLVVERHDANWELHGKRAGMVRNSVMIDSGVDACLSFSYENSPGTRHCTGLARKSGVTTRLFEQP